MKIRLFIFLIIFKTSLLCSQSLSDLTFGTTNNLDVVTWNLEWFAKSDQITLDSLVVAINALDIDIVAVQEISNVAEFQTLISQLNGYSGYTSVSNLRLGYIEDGLASISPNQSLSVSLVGWLCPPNVI